MHASIELKWRSELEPRGFVSPIIRKLLYVNCSKSFRRSIWSIHMFRLANTYMLDDRYFTTRRQPGSFFQNAAFPPWPSWGVWNLFTMFPHRNGHGAISVKKKTFECQVCFRNFNIYSFNLKSVWNLTENRETLKI